MSQILMDYVAAMHDVERASVKIRLAELQLSDNHSSALAVNKAQDELALAARRLARAVDALPMDRRPKEWGDT
jgi:hypothetical protein